MLNTLDRCYDNLYDIGMVITLTLTKYFFETSEVPETSTNKQHGFIKVKEQRQVTLIILRSMQV